ncbi:MAG: M1 family aminopeptidase [Candidatus Saliniplasma sp.]
MDDRRGLAPRSYDIKVRVEPEEGKLRVEAVLDLTISSDPSIEFYLHETFEIVSLKINSSDKDYLTEKNEPTPVNPASKKVIVQDGLEGSVEDTVELEVSYSGKLKDIPEFESMQDQKIGLDDRITDKHVELACYSAWYPYFGFGHDFDIDLELDIPSQLISVCSGRKLSSEEEGRRRIERWKAIGANDIVIVASPDFKNKTIEGSFGEFSVYYTKLPEDFIQREIEEIGGAIELYQDILGKSSLSGSTFKNVYSPKEKGQGAFSRNGMIVYSEGYVLDQLKEDPKTSLFKWNAHEIAHFWWNIGSGQADWINEAFAEYFSCLAVEEILSEKKFDEYLEKYEDLVEEIPIDAPSISEVEPYNTGENYAVRYYKAPLMLHRFRDRLGKEDFVRTSKDFYDRYKDSGVETSDFKSFWGEISGEKNLINTLEGWLTSKGGLPGGKR